MAVTIKQSFRACKCAQSLPQWIGRNTHFGLRTMHHSSEVLNLQNIVVNNNRHNCKHKTSSSLHTKRQHHHPSQILPQLVSSRHFHTSHSQCKDQPSGHEWLAFGEPDLNWDYIFNPENKESIKRNVMNRKGVGDIDRLYELLEQYRNCQEDKISEIRQEIIQVASDLPNFTHPDVIIGDESKAVEVMSFGKEKINAFDFKPKTVVELGEHLDTLRIRNMALTTGDNTFYLKGAFAMLERALISYTVDFLMKRGFRLFSVPDLLYPHIIEGCGFKTTGQNQVYKLKPDLYGNVCLAGTGEMSLAGFCMDQVHSVKDLPQRLMTASQCFRAETTNHENERGIYRVHHFLKVEMYGLTADITGTESQEFLDEFVKIQTELFEPLGFPFRVLDMPSNELGASAYRKYDIEAWMPAKGFWGEISSASNCIDYQSRRLSAKYQDASGTRKHCHTVNGTACAVPRMIMAIAESNQNKDMTITIPEVLRPFMNGVKEIAPPLIRTAMKPIKYTKLLQKNAKS